MDRKMYEPTEKLLNKYPRSIADGIDLPSDEEFKARWTRAHHGKSAGWGIAKRDYILNQMTKMREYQIGIWQGRVDKARGLAYSEDRNENAYNLGYHRGYTEYESNRRGWDENTRREFDQKYLN
jgi:hypothetical protein